jgi:nucleoside-diphosphate-sugar epimerase
VKVVVTGASGNVGTGLLRALAGATPAHEVVGVCRRPPPPDPPYDMARWHAVDLSAPGAAAALAEPFAGADAVVHLAWAIQPARDVADALARVLDQRAGGTFNIGAEPLGTQQLAELVGARLVTLPRAALAGAVSLASAGRLLAITPGWFRLLMEQPVLGTDHAAATLGWSPRHTTRQIVRELLDTIAEDRAGTSAVLREH